MFNNFQFPGNLLKFDTYIGIASSKNDAIDKAIEKNLAPGEPAVIEYMNEDSSTNEMLLAIGGFSDGGPYVISLIDASTARN